MSKPFRFKQFTISQNRAPMKVGTDGVLLGSWCPCISAKTILDIGTGTGLIALMMAQRNSGALIHAIEPNMEAQADAQLNLLNSPWADRIHLSSLSLRSFVPPHPFDLIVCNPPFFQKSLRNPSPGRSAARHNIDFSPADLAASAKWLNPEGVLSGIYPPDVYEIFHSIAIDQDLTLSRKMEVKPTPDKPVKRILFAYVKSGKPASSVQFTPQVLIIESHGRHQYSEAYIELTKEFYLGNSTRY